MLEIFNGVLIMSLIGSILTITLTILRPITERLFSGKWHYNTQKIVILSFMIPIITIANLSFSTMLNQNEYSVDEVYTSGYNTGELVSNNSQEGTSSVIDNSNSNENITSIEKSVTQKNYFDLNFNKVIPMSFVDKIINIWIIGIVICSLWYTFCYIKVKYELKKDISPVEKESEVYTIFERCKERVDIHREVKIYFKEDIKTPLVIGFFNNIVLVPQDILKYKNVNDILCHELTHVKRRDLLIKLIMTLTSIVHWFNPFIYILRNNVDMYCELSCDENITMHMSYEDRKKYGESVISIAESLIGVRRFGNAFGGNKNYIKRRLIMILKSKKQRKVIGLISVVVIGGVLLGSGYITQGISNKVKKNIVLSSENKNKDVNVESENVEPTIENNTPEENVDNNVEEKLEGKLEEEKTEEIVNNNSEIKTEKLVKEKQQVQKPQQTITNQIKYRSEKLGVEFTIPSYWKDKFTIEDTDTGISIRYIFQYDYSFNIDGEKVSRGENNKRSLIYIEDASLLSEAEMGMSDSKENVTRFKNIHGKKYVIGGPTDCLELKDPDRPGVEKFSKDIPAIINSMKEI